jgi:hypothetical protein
MLCAASASALAAPGASSEKVLTCSSAPSLPGDVGAPGKYVAEVTLETIESTSYYQVIIKDKQTDSVETELTGEKADDGTFSLFRSKGVHRPGFSESFQKGPDTTVATWTKFYDFGLPKEVLFICE